MVVVLSLGLEPSHQDYERLKRLENKIIEHAKGWERFKRDIPNLIRQGIDEVIDAPRTLRFTLDELKRIEKAYIGSKLKVLVLHHLQLERGKVLDVLIDGVEVGVANTLGSRWTIPMEAVGHPYILIREDEKTARCSFGLIVVTANAVRMAQIRGRSKRRIVGQTLLPVHWIFRDEHYPKNSWEDAYIDTKLD